MTDVRLLRLADELRERTALRAACDPPDFDTYGWAVGQLEQIRREVRADEALRLEGLIERLTGVRR